MDNQNHLVYPTIPISALMEVGGSYEKETFTDITDNVHFK